MPQPQSLDTYFETFVQALPADYMAQANEFKTFERARKIKSPQQRPTACISPSTWSI